MYICNFDQGLKASFQAKKLFINQSKLARICGTVTNHNAVTFLMQSNVLNIPFVSYQCIYVTF